MKALFIDGRRNGYSPDQCGRTFTIGELIERLNELAEEFGEDTPVYLRNDRGYTYGNIDDYSMNVHDEEDGNEDDDE